MLFYVMIGVLHRRVTNMVGLILLLDDSLQVNFI